MEMDYNFERFQVLCLYLAKIIEKRVMVGISCENSLDISLSEFQEHFVSDGI